MQKCTRCGAQVSDPFGFGEKIHDVDACGGLRVDDETLCAGRRFGPLREDIADDDDAPSYADEDCPDRARCWRWKRFRDYDGKPVPLWQFVASFLRDSVDSPCQYFEEVPI